MARLHLIFVIFAALMIGSAPIALADLNAGLKAAKKGDFMTALSELKPLAENGDERAQYYVGMIYNSVWVGQDFLEAVKWHRKAAIQGMAAAQFRLGTMYKNGHGVTEDFEEAVKWYSKRRPTPA